MHYSVSLLSQPFQALNATTTRLSYSACHVFSDFRPPKTVSWPTTTPFISICVERCNYSCLFDFSNGLKTMHTIPSVTRLSYSTSPVFWFPIPNCLLGLNKFIHWNLPLIGLFFLCASVILTLRYQIVVFSLSCFRISEPQTVSFISTTTFIDLYRGKIELFVFVLAFLTV